MWQRQNIVIRWWWWVVAVNIVAEAPARSVPGVVIRLAKGACIALKQHEGEISEASARIGKAGSSRKGITDHYPPFCYDGESGQWNEVGIE